MTDLPRYNILRSLAEPPWRWLQLQAAAVYLGVSPTTLRLKIIEGKGPRFYRFPGARTKIFKSSDLDEWVETSVGRPLTPAEVARTKKFQEGKQRALERRRAAKETPPQAKPRRAVSEQKIVPVPTRRLRRQRQARAHEDVI